MKTENIEVLMTKLDT